MSHHGPKIITSLATFTLILGFSACSVPTVEVVSTPGSASPSAAPGESASAAAPAAKPATVAIQTSCEALFGTPDQSRGPLNDFVDFLSASADKPADDMSKVKAAKADHDKIVKVGETAMEPLKSGIALMTKDTGPWLTKALRGESSTLNTDNFVAGGQKVTSACGADDDEPSTEPEPEPEPDPVDPYDKLSRAEQNAVDSARSYLENQGFSRAGLLNQLTSEYGEDFSTKIATKAIDFVEKQDNTSWNKEAEQAAESYLNSGSFSCSSLTNQLASEYGDKFTRKQAQHGAKSTGIC